MATNPAIYVREGRNTWHVARPGGPEEMTLCRRAPVFWWDERTTERPAPLCKRCAQLAGPA